MLWDMKMLKKIIAYPHKWSSEVRGRCADIPYGARQTTTEAHHPLPHARRIAAVVQSDSIEA